MQIEITNIITIVSISLIAGLIAYLLIRNWKKSSYNSKNNQVVLDQVRNSLEKQIYALNNRLIQSEERWRDVNHLLLRDEYRLNKSIRVKTRTTHYSEFLKANGISENDLIIDRRLIFILTPFNDNFAEDYHVIKDVCLSSGFNAKRGDEDLIKSDIFPEMLKLIVKSNLIIANINGRNPNVLYELGIAQALDKTVILISKEPEKLPVDIKSKQFLIYKTYPELREMLRSELINFI